MNKLCGVGYVVLLLILAESTIYCQTNTFPQSKRNPNKNRYAKPALPYGPKNQEPWYKGRGFEEGDFQEQSAFESQRLETENLRQAVQPKAPEDETRSSSNLLPGQ